VKNYLLDEQGGISRLVGVDGTAELYGYDEFGNMQHGTPSLAQPFGFTGYQHDPIAGTWFAQSLFLRNHTDDDLCAIIGRVAKMDKKEAYRFVPSAFHKKKVNL